MVDPVLVGSVVYGSIFGIMSIGLTMTYLTTKVPNFAYGSFVTVGIYAAFSLDQLNGLWAYYSLPVAFILGSTCSVLMYVLVLRPLSSRGSSLVALMIATLAVDTVFTGIINIFADYLTDIHGIIISKQFPPPANDFALGGVPGLFIATPVTLGAVTIFLFLLLTRTRFGIATRAAVENASLARTVGINVETVRIVSWFIAGGLAGMAGPFYIYLGGSTDAGSLLIVGIFSASVLGGLSSIYGAMLGGLLIGGSEIALTALGTQTLGSWVFQYETGIPLLIMIVTLLLIPQGLVSLDWRGLVRRGAKK
jgi:branched-chain amino acid transport system permease protein